MQVDNHSGDGLFPMADIKGEIKGSIAGLTSPACLLFNGHDVIIIHGYFPSKIMTVTHPGKALCTSIAPPKRRFPTMEHAQACFNTIP
jgi:hypothetical protein